MGKLQSYQQKTVITISSYRAIRILNSLKDEHLARSGDSSDL